MLSPLVKMSVMNKNGLVTNMSVSSAKSWREAFMIASPFDGFSAGLNIDYNLYRCFTLYGNILYARCNVRFEGTNKALGNKDLIKFETINFGFGFSAKFRT